MAKTPSIVVASSTMEYLENNFLCSFLIASGRTSNEYLISIREQLVSLRCRRVDFVRSPNFFCKCSILLEMSPRNHNGVILICVHNCDRI